MHIWGVRGIVDCKHGRPQTKFQGGKIILKERNVAAQARNTHYRVLRYQCVVYVRCIRTIGCCDISALYTHYRVLQYQSVMYVRCIRTIGCCDISALCTCVVYVL
jgi:hypothetical protein